MTGALRQTAALLLDSYRELNARKLFWITLIISTFVVASFAAVGLNAKGMTFLWWEFPSDYLNARQFSPALLYKFIFASFAIPIWLAWAATILALVSTASIIPEFIAGGAVELTLSRPISRTRLILTKYATGLLFAALQVSVFTLACFLVIGTRGHSWEPRLFLAVPIMILFFSYLYCVCTLLGLLTRSTIASLLLTILFWIVIAGTNGTEGFFLMFKINNELRDQKIQGYIEADKARIVKQQEELARLAPDAPARAPVELALGATQNELTRREKQLVDNRQSATWIGRGHQFAYMAKTSLPKTAETIKLLERSLLDLSELDKLVPPKNDDQGPSFSSDDVRINQRTMTRKVEEAVRARSLGWVIGTSLLFEALVLACAVRVFVRRDF
jgi:ABC-type transport system involved in multi-copper enzyme maturation permease subunit